MRLSFKQFWYVIEEGTAEEVTALQKQITDLDVQIQQRTKPLVDHKTRLQAMLAAKQKQLDTEQQAAAKTQGNTATPGTTTTTPGSTGQQTPGVNQSSATGVTPTQG